MNGVSLELRKRGTQSVQTRPIQHYYLPGHVKFQPQTVCFWWVFWGSNFRCFEGPGAFFRWNLRITTHNFRKSSTILNFVAASILTCLFRFKLNVYLEWFKDITSKRLRPDATPDTERERERDREKNTYLSCSSIFAWNLFGPLF